MNEEELRAEVRRLEARVETLERSLKHAADGIGVVFQLYEDVFIGGELEEEARGQLEHVITRIEQVLASGDAV